MIRHQERSSWRDVLSEIGRIFREAREAKNITYKQVDQDLKIKPRFIEALEEENFDMFPSVPMMRGFMRNYAEYLGMDSGEVLSMYDNNGYSGRRRGLWRPKQSSFAPMPMNRSSGIPFNPDALITFLLTLALIGSASFFAYTQYIEPAQAEILSGNFLEDNLDPQEDNLALTLPTPEPPPTNTPAPTLTPTPEYYTGVAVELEITERSWIQVLVDDVKVFDGFIEAGEQSRWDGEKRVAIRAGNAGGVGVYVNGQFMGPMGEKDQVVDQVWEKVEEDPAAENTATPTPQP